MVSAALLGTSAIQYLLLALPRTPVGVPPVSMLRVIFSAFTQVWESVFIPMSAPDLAVLGAWGAPTVLSGTGMFSHFHFLEFCQSKGIVMMLAFTSHCCLRCSTRYNFQNPFLASPGSPVRLAFSRLQPLTYSLPTILHWLATLTV